MSINITKIKNPKNYVQPFSKKMKTIAFFVVMVSMIIGAPIVWSSGGKPFSPLINLFLIVQYLIVWSYLSLLLFVFYKRTHLREYLLHNHLFWLSGLMALPIISLFSSFLPLIKNSFGTDIYIIITIISSLTWGFFYVIGKIINKQKVELFENETQEQMRVWQGLLKMTLLEIALLRFPKHQV